MRAAVEDHVDVHGMARESGEALEVGEVRAVVYED